MCVSQPVVVHLKLEDSINIRKLELDAIFSSYIKKRQALMFSDSITQQTIKLSENIMHVNTMQRIHISLYHFS